MVLERLIKKVIEVLLLAIVFFMPLVFFTQANDPFWVVEKFFLKFSVSLLAVIFVVYCAVKKQFPVIKTPYDLVFLIFIGLNLTGVFAGVNVYAWSDRVFINLCYIILYYITGWYLSGHTPNALNKLLIAALGSGFVMAFYGLIQAAGMDFMPWHTTFNGRAASTLGNPNFLAGHMVLLIPVAFAMAARRAGNLVKFVLILASVCMTAALFASQTRGAYIGFIVSMILLFALMVLFAREEFSRNKKTVIALAVIMTVLIGGFFVLKKDAVQRIADIISLKDDSARIRSALWKNSLFLVKDHPLSGSGAGNFYIRYPLYQSKSLTPEHFKGNEYYKSGHAHNDFIQFAAEYGIPGLGSLLFLFGLIFYSGITYLKRPEKDGMLTAGILAAFAGLMVHAFFNFPFQIIPTAALFYIFAAAAGFKQGGFSVGLKKVNPVSAVVMLVIAAGFMAEAALCARVLSADTYLRKAKENEHFNRPYEAMTFGSDAADLNPWNDETLYFYAQILEKTGNFEKSYNIHKKIYGLNPNHWESLNALFNFYAVKNDEKGRNETADRIYRISPYSEKAAGFKGYALYASGKFDDAIAVYELAIKNSGETASLLSQLSACYGALGNVQKTLLYADRAIELNPGFTDAYYNRAVAFYRMKNFKAAKENLNRILAITPGEERAKGLLKVIDDERKK